MAGGLGRKCILSMATLARRSIAPAPRRRPNAQIAKLKERLKSAAKRARGQGGLADQERTLFTLGAAAALAAAEKKGVQIPTVAGVDPALLGGAVCALLLPRYVGGKNAKRVQAIGDGLLAVAAHRSVQRGSVKVAGTEFDDDVAGIDDDDDD